MRGPGRAGAAVAALAATAHGIAITGGCLLLAGVLCPGARATEREGQLDLRALAPGVPRQIVEERLAVAGARGVPRGPRELYVEHPVLPRIFVRQTLRLELDHEVKLVRATLELAPHAGSTGEDLLGLYDDVMAELLRALGRPSHERRQGQARAGEELSALARGDLVRAAEWRLPHRVRLAIPRRVDGRMRVEVEIGEEAAR